MLNQLYNVKNWYWIVAGSTSQVYSSAAVAYVSVADTTYQAWLAAGNIPTKIDNEQDLIGVFASQYPAGWPPTTAQIAQAAAATALAAGLVITSTGTAAVNGTYSCTQESIANFNAIETYVLRNNTFPGPSTTQPWVQQNGSLVIIPSTTVFNAIATALADYIAQIQVYAYSGGQSGSLPSNHVTIA